MQCNGDWLRQIIRRVIQKSDNMFKNWTAYVLMSVAPDSIKGWADRAAHSWPHLSLPATLGRSGCAPYWLQQLGELVPHLTWAAQESWPCSLWSGLAGPETYKSERGGPAPLVCYVVAWVRERLPPPPCSLPPVAGKEAEPNSH